VDDRYLNLGLSAMATAGEPFMAHFGAAVLAGWWFSYDQHASADLDRAIGRTAERVVDKHSWLFENVPSARPDATLEAELVEHVGGAHLDGVWAIGHDVIFTALAVRTFQARPELCTGPIVYGLHRLVDACHQDPLTQIANVFDVTDATGADLAALRIDEPSDVARVALETMVGFTHVYVGLHQGHIGHVIDHAHALLTLDRLGHRAEAQQGRRGFLTHVAALRKVWHEQADLTEVAVGVTDDARQPAYWEHDYATNDWAVGHVFKYPYALYDLLALVDDPSLAKSSIQRMGELIVDGF
jgi:hypothetical protein